MEYTKGEWKIGNDAEPIIILGDNGIHIAKVYQKANAQLIASALDLYEFVKAIAETKVMPVSYIELAQKIVAKAEGK